MRAEGSKLAPPEETDWAASWMARARKSGWKADAWATAYEMMRARKTWLVVIVNLLLLLWRQGVGELANCDGCDL